MSQIQEGDIFIPEGYPEQLDHSKYIYEGFGIIFVILYIICYFHGTHSNNSILKKYYKNCSELYETNFAHVGITKEHNGPLYHAESAHSFKFYASGRINCLFMQLSIELQKRQDIISTLLFSFIWPEKDQIKFDIPISVAPQPLCFALLKKKDAQTYKENNIDIKHLTQKVQINNLEGNYVGLGEDNETMNAIFDSKVVGLLNKYDKYISQIHLTDQKTLSLLQINIFILKSSPYHLRVVLNISENQNEVQELTQMVLYLLDRIANLKLSNSIKQKNDKERQSFQELKLKDEKLKRVEVKIRFQINKGIIKNQNGQKVVGLIKTFIIAQGETTFAVRERQKRRNKKTIFQTSYACLIV